MHFPFYSRARFLSRGGAFAACVLSAALGPCCGASTETPTTTQVRAEDDEPAVESEESQLPVYRVKGAQIQTSEAEQTQVAIALSLKFGFGWFTMSGDYAITPNGVPQGVRNISATILAFDDRQLSRLQDRATRSPFDARLFQSMPRASRDARATRIGLRALVLLDGIPASDPFDGTISDLMPPTTGIARAEAVWRGGSVAWGNGALGGVIQLFTNPVQGTLITDPGNGRGQALDGGPLVRHVHPTGQFVAEFGAFNQQRFELITSQPTIRGVLQIYGSGQHSDDVADLMPALGGTADRAHWQHGAGIGIRWRQPVAKEIEMTVAVQLSDMESGDGAAFRGNRREANKFSITLVGETAQGLTWNGRVYSHQSVSSGGFSFLTGQRDLEAPFLKQSDVGGRQTGLAVSATRWLTGDARVIAGFDFSRTSGNAHTEYQFNYGSFSRARESGGDQTLLGTFAELQQPLTDNLRAMAGLRVQGWTESGGFSNDSARINPVSTVGRRFGNSTGGELAPSLGLIWVPIRGWTFRIDASTGFRRPSLQERYHAWTDNLVLIEGNQGLPTERSAKIEFGVERFWRDKGRAAVYVFTQQVRDAVGSITILPNSTAEPVLQGLPAALEVRQRSAFDRIELSGVMAAASWQFGKTVSAVLNWEATRGRVVRMTRAPALAGNHWASLPAQRLSLQLVWQPRREWELNARLLHTGHSYLDEENFRRLDPETQVDGSVRFNVNQQFSIYSGLNNAGGTRPVRFRAIDGTPYVGPPRRFYAGVDFKW